MLAFIKQSRAGIVLDDMVAGLWPRVKTSSAGRRLPGIFTPFSEVSPHSRAIVTENFEQRSRILIVDSNPLRRRALHGNLLAAGFDPANAEDAEEAFQICRVLKFDIVFLNVEYAGTPAKACRLFRSNLPHCALVVLASFNDPDQNADVLEAGADQCLAGKLHMPTLVACVRAILRRILMPARPADAAITIGEIRLDPVQRVASRAGVPVRLSFKEFAVLHYLMAHAGTPIAHETLLKAVWGEGPVNRLECLRIVVSQLRRKLKDQVRPQYLFTESWIGYRFASASEVRSAIRPAEEATAA